MKSAAYSLSLSNPAVEGKVKNVIYLGLDKGNTLSVTIGNNSGLDLPLNGTLTLLISANIMDTNGAAKLEISTPGWKLQGAKLLNGYYNFSVTIPPGQKVIPNGGNLGFTLGQMVPCTKENGQVIVQLDDFGSPLKISSLLIVMGKPNPDLPKLIGDDEVLHFVYKVNDGDEETPITVLHPPVNQGNVQYNTMQMVLNFQPSNQSPQEEGDWLLNKWDAANPPEFRFFFPYFSPNDRTPAYIDLTDCFKKDDPNYNEFTSAWNIKDSLESDNPNIQSNHFWEIICDPSADFPFWRVRPTANNLHLFTADSDSENPGPLLNLYWSAIVSALNIDQSNSETLLYLQWLNFPGYSEGVITYTVFKKYPKPIVKPVINCFTGKIIRYEGGIRVELNWNTTGEYCLISGDSNHKNSSTADYPCNTGDSPYTIQVNVQNPLPSSFTLTAVGPEGPSNSTTQTLRVKWKINPDVGTNLPNAAKIRVLGDNSSVVVLQSDRSYQGTTALVFLSPVNLATNQPAFPFPANNQAFDLALNPVDSDSLYAFGPSQDGNCVYAFKKSTRSLTSSSALFLPANETYLFVSGDGARLAVVNLGDVSTTMFYVLHTATLDGVPGSPVNLGTATIASSFAWAPQSGRCAFYTLTFILSQRRVLDPTLNDIGSPTTTIASNLLFFALDESFLINGEYLFGNLTKYNAQNFQEEGSITLNLENDSSLLLQHVVTPDNKLLFLLGNIRKTQTQALNVYDLENLSILDWSPWAGQSESIRDFTIAPDGVRMFALTEDGKVVALDPYI